MAESGRNPKETHYGEWKPSPEDLAKMPEAMRSALETQAPEAKRPAELARREPVPIREPDIESFATQEAAAYMNDARAAEQQLLGGQADIQKKALGKRLVQLPQESVADALAREAQVIEVQQAALRDRILGDRMRAESLMDGVQALARGERPPADFAATLDLVEREAAEAVAKRQQAYEKDPAQLGVKEDLEQAQGRLTLIADLRAKAGV